MMFYVDMRILAFQIVIFVFHNKIKLSVFNLLMCLLGRKKKRSTNPAFLVREGLGNNGIRKFCCLES